MILNILNNAISTMGVTYSLIPVSDPKTVVLEFDIIDECTTNGSATVTKYPTEYGTYVTDYKYKNPDTVRLTGIISSGGLTGYTSILPRMNTWDRKSAIAAIRTQLSELVANMKLVNIQTRNAGRRENMTLTQYEINESYDNYGSLEVTMQFTQVPQFKESGTVQRNVSNTNTVSAGITETQQVMVAATGALIFASTIAASS